MTYYLLEIGGTMEWNKEGIFPSLELVHEYLAWSYSMTVEDVKTGLEDGGDFAHDTQITVVNLYDSKESFHSEVDHISATKHLRKGWE